MLSIPGSHILVLGATSTLARAVCHRLAADGASLYLAARNAPEAERLADDLHVRYNVPVAWGRIDVTDYAAHAALLTDAETALGPLDAVLVAVGTLGDADRAATDPDHVRQVIAVNYTAVVAFLTCAAARLQERGQGVLAAFSSVAGDRGRASNYVYGSAKAGLSTFLDGLRGRLYGSGVHVLTIKPGPVDTKMTFGMDDPPPLMADPERVADDVVEALRRGTDVLYTPGLWRLIMAVLRTIPESLFKRMSL